MKKFRKLFGLVFLVGICVAAYYGLKKLEEGQLTQSVQDELSNWHHANPDVYAWLNVEGTNIDYPVAQHPSDDSYYLSHDLEHNSTYYGAIFTERVNSKTFEDPVTIIYGHAIQDGSMFGSLANFADETTFEQYRTIVVETADTRLTYDIFAAYQFSDDHLYHTFQLGEKEKVKEYVANIESQARNQAGFYRSISFDIEKDKLLILSTCDAQTDQKRFVLHAIRRNE